MTFARTLSPCVAPLGLGQGEVAPPALLGIQDEARSTLTVLLATGASRAEAFAQVAATHGLAAALPLVLEAMDQAVASATKGVTQDGHEGPGAHWAVALLDRVAKLDADLALAALLEWGRNRWLEGNLYLNHRTWVTACPDLRSVGGMLDLAGSLVEALPAALAVGGLNLDDTPITALPSGLRVAKRLVLAGSAIEHLPEDLEVEGTLDLRYCRTWDGRIPAGVQRAAALVYTDGHPNGVVLRAWRNEHPYGEARP
jgi:hypothetical protein